MGSLLRPRRDGPDADWCDGDGSYRIYADPLGCNVFYSAAVDAFRICRRYTGTGVVSSPSCGTFETTLGWLENFGTGQNGIDWVVLVEIDCGAP